MKLLLALVCAAAAAQDEDQAATSRLGVYDTTMPLMRAPSALEFAGELYVAESDLNRVSRWSHGGFRNMLGEFGADKLLDPRGLAVDATKIYVSDSGHHRIAQFTLAGEFVRAFGRYGDAPGEFRDPRGLAVTKDALYVCDTGNDRVQKLTLDGKPIAQVGERGHGEAEFVRPSNVAVDAQGFVYVTDTGNHRVQKFDAELEFVKSWGDFGPHQGFFAFPEGIESFDGQIYVVDTDNHRVEVFDTDGKYVYEWGVHALLPREGEGKLHYPSAIAIDTTGIGWQAWIAEPNEDRIQIFRGSKPDEAIPETKSGERVVAAHYGPHLSLAVDLLAVVEPAAPSILLYDVDAPSQRWEPINITKLSSWGRKVGQFLFPTDVELDWAHKLLYVADADAGRLSCFRIAHDETSEVKFDFFLLKLVRSLDLEELHRLGRDRAPFAIRPAALELGEDGHVWVLDSLQRTVFDFTPDLECIASYEVAGSSRPIDLAWDTSTKVLYAVDELTSTVFVLDDERHGFRPAPGDLGRPRDASFRAGGIAVGLLGAIYVSDPAASQIRSYGDGGQHMETFGAPGLLALQFHKPRGLEVDSIGRLWILDWGNHRGQVIYPDEKSFVGAFGSRSFTRPALKK